MPCLRDQIEIVARPPHPHPHPHNTWLVRIRKRPVRRPCGLWTNRMPILVRTVALAPGEGLWGNPVCLIEASSATSGDETRLRTTASLLACSQSRFSLQAQQELGPDGGRVGLDSTGRAPGPQVSSWAVEMASTDRSRSVQGGPPPVLGSSLLCRWRVMAHPCPWTVHLHEWLRTANGSSLLRNSNETSQYHRRGVALLDTLWQSDQPFALQYVSQSCLG